MIMNKDQYRNFTPKGPFDIDLNSSDGNPYNLLREAENYARQKRLDIAETKEILNRMRSGDLENLIKVFDEEFGDYVQLYYGPVNMIADSFSEQLDELKSEFSPNEPQGPQTKKGWFKKWFLGQ